MGVTVICTHDSPEVLWLELMVFYTAEQCESRALIASIHSTHSVWVMTADVAGQLGLNGAAPGFVRRLTLIRLQKN